MVSSTILGSAFGKVSSCLHHMRVHSRPFSIDSPVQIKRQLFQPIQKKCPQTGFVLSTGIVNNPLIYPRLYNPMLYRYSIGNFRVAVLITPMKRSPCLRNSSAADTDSKYESAQTILFVLAHVRISSFRIVVP